MWQQKHLNVAVAALLAVCGMGFIAARPSMDRRSPWGHKESLGTQVDA